MMARWSSWSERVSVHHEIPENELRLETSLTLERNENYVLCSFLRGVSMFREIFEEAAALTSLALFLGMIAIWAQVFAAL